MSKKVKNSAYAKPTKSDIKKAKIKKALIIIVAVIAAAAVVAATAMVIKNYVDKKRFENINEAVTNEYETLPQSQGEELTYVNYKGAIMPEEFARILNQAAIDSSNACKTAGVALEINGIQVSVPEFRVYYFERAQEQYEYTFYMEEQKGMNGTGFDYYKDPAQQTRLKETTTWEEHFVNEAVEDMQFDYAEFERACKAGIKVPAEDATQMLQMLSQYAAFDFTSNFGEGATYEMYCAKYIRELYGYEFYTQDLDKKAEAFTKEEVLAEYNKDKKAYQVVNARIYPIEGGYSSGDADGVKTEKQFLEYAEHNYQKVAGGAEFDIDERTYQWCISYTTAANTYGDSIAEWLFDDSRKPGDISVQKGLAYNCLLYIEETKYDPHSSDIIYIDIPYNLSDSSQSAEAQKQEVQKIYDEWKAGEATADSLKAAFKDMGTVNELTARTGEYKPDADMWIHKEKRQSGDSTVFYSESGAYIFYYVSANEDDYDWQETVRNDMAIVDYTDEYDKYIESDYSDIKKNKELIDKAADAANAQCAEFVESYKSSSGR